MSARGTSGTMDSSGSRSHLQGGGFNEAASYLHPSNPASKRGSTTVATWTGALSVDLQGGDSLVGVHTFRTVEEWSQPTAIPTKHLNNEAYL